MFRIAFSTLIVAGLVTVTTPTPLAAETYDKLAYLTFSGQVQVPGVTLSAGTYRFRLADPTERKIIQVLSRDGATVHAMFFTLPDSRRTATNDATVTFMETPTGVPPAVKSLFYGGELNGYQFVYPPGSPNMVPKVGTQPEIIYTPNPAPTKAPEAFATPAPSAVPPPASVPEPGAAVEPAAAPASPVQAAELPKTATPLPWVATGGLTSLLAGLGMGLLRKVFG